MFQSPEPTPNWNEALGQWGIYWNVHIYCFGTLYAICGIWNVFSLAIQLDQKRKGASKKTFKTFLTSNILLAYFNIMRACCLFIDPYYSNFNRLFIPSGAVFLAWRLTISCLVSTFMLINLALLEVTKMQVYSKRLQSMKPILLILTTSFVMGLSVDLVTILLPGLFWLSYVCQFIFLFMGLAFAGMMMYSGYRVLKTVKRSKRDIQSFSKFNDESRNGRLSREIGPQGDDEGQNSEKRMVDTSDGITLKDMKIPGDKTQGVINKSFEPTDYEGARKETATLESSCTGKKEEIPRDITRDRQRSSNQQTQSDGRTKNRTQTTRKGTKRLTVLVIIISSCAILYSVIQVYSLLAVFKLSDYSLSIDNWHWLGYQMAARFLEVGMSFSMSYIVRANISCR